MPKKRKKVGLALGGGAVRGLIHVGVIKALMENNIPIDYIAGCSIGAWVGAYFATYENIDIFEKEAARLKRATLFSFLEPTFPSGLVRGDALRKIVAKTVGHKKFSDLVIPLAIVATDINNGQEVDIHDGDLVSAIMGSMAVPIMYKPVRRNGKILVDGGLSNPVPDNIVKKMGADVVISVSLDNYDYAKIYKDTKMTLLNVASRSFSIIYRNLSFALMSDSDIVIKPKNDLVGMTGWKRFFMDKIDQKFINIGRKEAERAMPKIKELIS